MKQILLSCFAASMLLFAACKNDEASHASVNAEDTTEARNIKIIKASMEGMNKGDVDMMMKDASPDCMDYGDGSMEPMRNTDSTRAMMKNWFAAFPDFKCSNSEYFADDDKVVVISDCSGTWKNDFMGMKATGKSFKFKDADIFTISDKGQIVSHRNIQNMGYIMGSVGMSMPGMEEKK